MLKRLVNELRCTLTLTTTGPVLVKSGHATVSGPDMTPVRTYRNGEWQVYLPGSSLKGVLRSHLEKICRTLRPGTVCNPFIKTADAVQVDGNQLLCTDFADVSCGDKFQLREKGQVRANNRIWARRGESLDNARVYADSCPICRLFGSTSFAGRLNIADAYLTGPGPGRVEPRDGVGIDRLTGGAATQAQALFQLEAVSSGVGFQSEIHLRNFECWQLGMVFAAIADLRDELLRVGSGRSRGLGAVRGDVAKLIIYHLAPTPGRAPQEVWGLGRFLGDSSYGTRADDLLPVTPGPVEVPHGLRRSLTFTEQALAALEQAACAELGRWLAGWVPPAGMQWQTDWVRR